MTASGADDRTEERADAVLPEERAAGGADRQAQAAAVLADSDERSTQRDQDEPADVERRTSTETVEP
jgi:hypothetical protein